MKHRGFSEKNRLPVLFLRAMVFYRENDWERAEPLFREITATSLECIEAAVSANISVARESTVSENPFLARRRGAVTSFWNHRAAGQSCSAFPISTCVLGWQAPVVYRVSCRVCTKGELSKLAGRVSAWHASALGI
jgi:hypothetical protein